MIFIIFLWHNWISHPYISSSLHLLNVLLCSVVCDSCECIGSFSDFLTSINLYLGKMLNYVCLSNFDIYLFLYYFRFKSDEERTPVYRIVEETFPQVLSIFNSLVQIANLSLEVADLIKLICKIFWSSIYVSLMFNSRQQILVVYLSFTHVLINLLAPYFLFL